MSKSQKLLKEIDEVLSAPSLLTGFEEKEYAEELDEYYAENYKFNTEIYG